MIDLRGTRRGDILNGNTDASLNPHHTSLFPGDSVFPEIRNKQSTNQRGRISLTLQEALHVSVLLFCQDKGFRVEIPLLCRIFVWSVGHALSGLQGGAKLEVNCLSGRLHFQWDGA